MTYSFVNGRSDVLASSRQDECQYPLAGGAEQIA